MTYPPDEMVWIGDLSGFEIVRYDDGDVYLVHRCGAEWPVDPPGAAYLGNLIVNHIRPHRAEGCRGAST